VEAMNPTMNEFENALMKMFTAGDLLELAILREQWERARALRHDFGPEFMTEFDMPADCPRLGHLSTDLTDVEGWCVEAGVVWMFALAIRDGRIDFLNCSTPHDLALVPPASECSLSYKRSSQGGTWLGAATGERDLDYVRRTLGAGGHETPHAGLDGLS
jgi:hypothetical protein